MVHFRPAMLSADFALCCTTLERLAVSLGRKISITVSCSCKVEGPSSEATLQIAVLVVGKVRRLDVTFSF